MAHRGPLHGPLHGADAATGDDIQAPQSQLETHLLGIVVFVPGDGVTAPAHNQVRGQAGTHHPGIAQDSENRIGDFSRGGWLALQVALDLVVGVDDIAQSRKQMFLDAADHLAIDKCLGRRVENLHLEPPGLGYQADVEVRVGLHDLGGIVLGAIGVEDSQGTVAEEPEDIPAGGGQSLDFLLGKQVEGTERPNRSVADFIH